MDYIQIGNNVLENVVQWDKKNLTLQLNNVHAPFWMHSCSLSTTIIVWVPFSFQCFILLLKQKRESF